MKLELALTAEEIQNTKIKGKVLAVFDVFRATSTIITAFENGCHAIVPAVSVDEANAKFKELQGRNGDVLLAGERSGIRIPGMDLGNSPMEYMNSNLRGKTIVMFTSNGTLAIRGGYGAERIYIGALLNARAVALKLAEKGRDIVLGCAGRLGEFSLEDFLAAGAVTYFIRQMVPVMFPSDLVVASESCFLNNRDCLKEFLSKGKHGRYLAEIGFQEDVDYCSRLNVSQIVPEFRNGQIRVTFSN